MYFLRLTHLFKIKKTNKQTQLIDFSHQTSREPTSPTKTRHATLFELQTSRHNLNSTKINFSRN